MAEWTITEEGERPLTVNKVATLNRFAWAARTRSTRRRWWTLVLLAKVPVPHFQAITVDATPLHKDNRSPQDVGACAPHVKAAIDGLVDAGVIPDDNPSHLRAVTFHPPRVAGVNGLELTIRDVA